MESSTGHTLITGASSGIGRGLAHQFACRGHSLVLVARRLELLEQLAAELRSHPVEVRCLAVDLTAAGAVEDLVETLAASGIRIEILVNNAGSGRAGLFARQPLQPDLATIDLNVRVPVELCKRFLPPMLGTGKGKILNICSTGAFQPGPNLAVYYASKAFLLSFSEALSRETRGSGVTVTAFCPGPTATEFHQKAGMLNSRAVRGRRLPSPDQVAAAAYQALVRGKAVAVHGFLNRGLLLLVRLLPRSWVREAVFRIQTGAGKVD